MRTQTLFVRFDKLAQIEGAVHVVTVALVCNDIAVANPGLGRYMKMRCSPRKEYIGRGGSLYFARLIAGHLAEGIGAIHAIRDVKALRRVAGPVQP